MIRSRRIFPSCYSGTHVTIRHLLTMSSGLRYHEGSLPWTDDTLTYYEPDLRAVGLSASIERPPGEEFLYNNYNLILEGIILERATGQRVSDYLATRLWQPLGAEADASWSLDSEAHGFEKMESGLNATPRDFARLGLLVANDGRVGRQQVLPAAWIRQSISATTAGGAADFYGLHWWTGMPHSGPFPAGAVMAWGNHGQYIYVLPERDIVIVRLGERDDAAPPNDWPHLFAKIAAQM